MGVTEDTDGAVVQRVLAGDVEAFALLVDRHHPRLARYAVHLLGDHGEAEEAVQDAFVRAYRSLARYEDRERFGAWVLRILVNRCRTALQRDSRRSEATAAWMRDTIAAGEAAWTGRGETTFEPEERVKQETLRKELAAALAQLPAAQREAVVLRHGEELAYEEIAVITGTGISALKMRVKRGCERLRSLLEASRAET